MTSTVVKDDLSAGTPVHKVSSSYLTILNRHLSSIAPNSHKRKENLDKNVDSQSYTIDIDEVSETLELIEKRLGRANFGLDIGQNMHPSDYGIFGYAMMNCESLYAALKTAAQHKSILNQKLYANFIEGSEDIYYQINTDLNTRDSHILIELDFSTAFEFAKKLAGPFIGGDVRLKAVYFSHKPLGPISHYEACFGCPVHFNAVHNQLVLNRSELDIPVYGANPKVLSALEDKILKVVSYYDNELMLSQRVAQYVSKKLEYELPSANKAASDFFMSVSLFKKRLSEEGTSYIRICDEVRLKKGRELIQKNKSNIKEIAFQLGFSNASAFNRAFKKWTGLSPSEYRKIELD